jgi:hypothetical protein
MEIERSVLDIFFPQGTLDWFEVVEVKSDDNNVYITLEEKNLPPLTEQNKGQIKAVKFHDLTITDFPLRGKRTLLTFRRRYWQIEGQTEYLKRDIKLAFPGTQLEQEFAAFLKEDGGRTSGLASFYRRVAAPPDQRI